MNDIVCYQKIGEDICEAIEEIKHNGDNIVIIRKFNNMRDAHKYASLCRKCSKTEVYITAGESNE